MRAGWSPTGMPIRWPDEHPDQKARPDQGRQEPGPAEQVEGSAVVGGDELDGGQVEQAPPESGDPVLGLAVQPRVVLHLDLGDREPGPGGQHRQVPVELAIEVDRLGDLATKHLQPAVEVPSRALRSPTMWWRCRAGRCAASRIGPAESHGGR